jgi:hypothetical protein
MPHSPARYRNSTASNTYEAPKGKAIGGTPGRAGIRAGRSSEHKITCFPSVQVMSPFRDTGCAARQPWLPSAPGTVVPAGPPVSVTGVGGPAFTACYFLRIPMFPLSRGTSRFPASNSARAASHADSPHYPHVARIAFGLLPSLTALMEPARAGPCPRRQGPGLMCGAIAAVRLIC